MVKEKALADYATQMLFLQFFRAVKWRGNYRNKSRHAR